MIRVGRVELWRKVGGTNASNLPLLPPFFIFWGGVRRRGGWLLPAKLQDF